MLSVGISAIEALKMKRLTFLLFLLMFSSSAFATVYIWVNQEGTVNVTDDYSRIPLTYYDSVKEIDVPKAQRPTLSQVLVAQSVQSAQPPPISQTLIREGAFAINLAESLKLGRTSNEAEAESLLASVGISPKNGWIADYPVTPDIIGELKCSIVTAVDSGRLAMTRDAAIKALQDLDVQQGLPVSVSTESQGTEGEPVQNYGEYSNPEVINNYYYKQGPPVVTYYSPPPDYGYLYSWVSYPFWCSGFWFPGYYILSDFHRFIDVRGRRETISNHVLDPKTGRVFSVDSRTRNIVRPPYRETRTSYVKGSTSPQNQRKASSMPGTSRQVGVRSPVSSGTGSSPGRQPSLSRNSDFSTLKGRAETVSPPTAGQMSPRSSGNPGSGTSAPRSTLSSKRGPLGGFRGSSGLGSGTFKGGDDRRN